MIPFGRPGGAHWSTFVLRTPVFAFRAAGQAHWSTFVLRTPVFAFRAAGQAHEGNFKPAKKGATASGAKVAPIKLAW